MQNLYSGLDVFKNNADLTVRRLLSSCRCGLVTNHTGRTRGAETTLSVLESAGVDIVTLFSPEHGLSGNREGDIESGTAHERTVYSLYGETRSPTPDMLTGLNALLFDIQDVGARFYTYSSTMKLCLEACYQQNISFVVFDRPNPLGGRVDGPLIDEKLKSFVGSISVPVQHGMTMGELALKVRHEHAPEVDLHVVPAGRWNHGMEWPATGLPWVPPSPNLPDFESARWYPGLCLLEFCDLAVGRGTPSPFQIIGAPGLDAESVARELQHHEEALSGILWKAIDFVPERATHQGVLCHGLHFTQDEPTPLQAVALGMALIAALHAAQPDLYNEEHLARSLPLLGSREVFDLLLRNDLAAAIATSNEQAQHAVGWNERFRLYP